MKHITEANDEYDYPEPATPEPSIYYDALVAQANIRLPFLPPEAWATSMIAELAAAVETLSSVRKATPAPQPTESIDERIVAWDELVHHPFFAECFNTDDTLLNAMLRKLSAAPLPAEGVAASPSRTNDRCPTCGHHMNWSDGYGWICNKRGGCGNEYEVIEDEPAEGVAELIARFKASAPVVWNPIVRGWVVSEDLREIGEWLAALSASVRPTPRDEELTREWGWRHPMAGNVAVTPLADEKQFRDLGYVIVERFVTPWAVAALITTEGKNND